MANANIYDFTDTWNDAGTLNGIKLTVTNTLSGASSNLLNLAITAGASAVISKGGVLTLNDGSNSLAFSPVVATMRTNLGLGTIATLSATNPSLAGVTLTGHLLFTDNTYDIGASGATRPRDIYASRYLTLPTSTSGIHVGNTWILPSYDGFFECRNNAETIGLHMGVDASNTLALRNSTTAQAFHIYNTWTNSSNYERIRIGWNGNNSYIGTENAGTGSSRDLYFVAGGSSRLVIGGSGGINISGAGLPTSDPGVAGQLWNSSGTLKVSSAGPP